MTTTSKAPEMVHLRAAPPQATCEIHDWPTDGLGRRLLAAMRERHGKGGVNVCRECVTRARDDAKAEVAQRMSSVPLDEVHVGDWATFYNEAVSYGAGGYKGEALSPNLGSYDRIIVAFSGGKDSLACLLHLLDEGVPRERLELWHHDIDGREGSSLMDWPCTRDYCRAVAAAFGVPIYFSWKQGGFEREMLRADAPTAPTVFETPEGLRTTGGRGKPGTRGQFPQVSPDLSVRWCSAYLKIDPCAMALRNQARFEGRRTLVVTGERAEESASRARYKVLEPHRADNRDGRVPRHVDQWRPVHSWAEREVWAIIERHRVNPHPCYRLGWGRCSCAACIFGSPGQWASLRAANPAQFAAVAGHEARSGKTIQRKLSVIQLADKGTAYPMREEDIRAALDPVFDEPIILSPGAWTLPRGAYGDSCGPT